MFGITQFVVFTVCLTACTGTLSTYYVTVPSCYHEMRRIAALPNERGLIHYWKSGNDSEFNRLVIKESGEIFSLHPLVDLAGRRLHIEFSSQSILTRVISHHNLVLRVIDGNLKHLYSKTALPSHCSQVNWRRKRRVKRAVRDISIEKTVRESVSEVNLDYASQGVVEDANNRFYLAQSDRVLPFTRTDLRSGVLVVDNKHPLDYETAELHQYELTVFVNNTANTNGKCCITVTGLSILVVSFMCCYYRLEMFEI